MSTSSELKRRAKEQLAGNYGTLILCNIILYAINIFLSMSVINFLFFNISQALKDSFNNVQRLDSGSYNFNVPILPALINFAIVAPITLGFTIMYLKVTREKDIGVHSMFEGFKGKGWGNSLLLGLAIGFFRFLWGAAAFLSLFPVVLLLVLSKSNLVAFFIIGLTLFLLTIFTIYINVRYIFCYFILADNPGIGPMEVLRKNKKIIKGRFFNILYINYISFFLWFLLYLPTFGIIHLYVGPLMNTVKANLYQELKKEMND
jgi:uncharacterized membrane protein